MGAFDRGFFHTVNQITGMTSASYLDRFLEPIADAMTPELARVIVNLRADERLQSEVELLREKANAGTLTPEEDAQPR